MSISATNNAYQGVLSILSSSADAATNDTESASAKLVDIAKKATSGQNTTSSATSTDPTDTISLSDDAISYLSAQKSGDSSSATGPNSPEAQQFFAAWNQAFAGFDPKGSLDKQVADMGDPTLQAAYKSGNYKIVNVNDIQGLDFVQHGDGPMHNTGLVYSTENTAVQSQFDAANPDAMNLSLPGYGSWYMIPTNQSAATSATSASTSNSASSSNSAPKAS